MKLSKSTSSKKNPLTTRCLVPLLPEDQLAVEDAQAAVARAQLIGASDGLSSARKRLDEVLDDIGPRGLEITFRSIGRNRFEELKRDCPPTEEQKASAGANRTVEWNAETFGPKLCAAAAVDCDMSESDWRTDIWESPDWGPSEVAQLFNAAVAVNNDSKVVELGN